MRVFPITKLFSIVSAILTAAIFIEPLYLGCHTIQYRTHKKFLSNRAVLVIQNRFRIFLGLPDPDPSLLSQMC